jgi:hypothetical protein
VTTETAAHGIQTTYRSTRFRSRLEARWAAFFDLVDWDWTYEPFDTAGWIPDFLIAGDRPLLVEVGPVSTDQEFRDKAEKPLGWLQHSTLILGISPVVLGDEQAGLVTTAGAFWRGYWERCDDCIGLLRVASAPTGNLPCGHTEGRSTNAAHLFDMWAKAGNDVQWKPKRWRR